MHRLQQRVSKLAEEYGCKVTTLLDETVIEIEEEDYEEFLAKFNTIARDEHE